MLTPSSYYRSLGNGTCNKRGRKTQPIGFRGTYQHVPIIRKYRVLQPGTRGKTGEKSTRTYRAGELINSHRRISPGWLLANSTWPQSCAAILFLRSEKQLRLRVITLFNSPIWDARSRCRVIRNLWHTRKLIRHPEASGSYTINFLLLSSRLLFFN